MTQLQDAPLRIARGAKLLAEASLSGSGLARIARAQRRRDVLVLAYHNIVPEGARAVGDASLHLPQRAFARQLDALRTTHRVVPLAEILSGTGESDRPRAAITFDDAYAGAVEAGVAELVRRGLPGTVFVAPAFVNGGTFWWDEIADAAAGEVEPAVREHALTALRGRVEEVRAWAAGEGIRLNSLPSHQRVASERALAEAAAQPGITLASHSWSHPNLTALTAAELDEELTRPLAWLRARFGSVVPWLTYPYGLYSPEVEAAAARAGYEGALRVEGGWLSPAAGGYRPHALPRMNVPAGLSQRGFELRAAGLLRRG